MIILQRFICFLCVCVVGIILLISLYAYSFHLSIHPSSFSNVFFWCDARWTFCVACNWNFNNKKEKKQLRTNHTDVFLLYIKLCYILLYALAPLLTLTANFKCVALSESIMMRRCENCLSVQWQLIHNGFKVLVKIRYQSVNEMNNNNEMIPSS